jgi:hypothetical protein
MMPPFAPVQTVFRDRLPFDRPDLDSGYLTDGTRLMWEYPRATPDGDQMDFVEVMEVKDGLIQHYRVYWGWFGFEILRKGQYQRS